MANHRQRWIVHIDMDAYFASVEQRDNPAYRGKPVIVGGLSGRGVVATASYEARKFGVRSAMPMVEARRRCPEGIYLSPNIAKYSHISHQIHQIFEEFSPAIEPLSLDEAFLDVTGMEYLYPTMMDIPRQIKDRIQRELHLTASAGLAGNKFLAKLASDLQKPNGLMMILPGEEVDLLGPMPVHRLWGIGRTTAALLKSLHIHTIADFRSADIKLLERHLGKSALELYNLAWGKDDTPIVPDRQAKSIGNENTFPADLRSKEEIRAALLSLCEKIGWRLRKAGLYGRTITVKIRFSSFRTVTRSTTLPSATALDEVIHQTAIDLLEKITTREGIRLLGVTVSKLSEGEGQLSLFTETDTRLKKVNAVMDKLKDKFGETIITRGGTL